MKENTKNARINVRAITFTAVMAALVFVFTYTFKIPFVNGYTHIGDSMIFLAIVFLGWKKLRLRQVSAQLLRTLSEATALGLPRHLLLSSLWRLFVLLLWKR